MKRNKPGTPGTFDDRNRAGEKHIRVFVAIGLPDPVIEWLAGIQAILKKETLPVQWTRPGNIHLTLKFLGEISPDMAASVCRVVAASAEKAASFALFAQGVGVFPGIRRPRVIWTGIGGRTDLLGTLRQDIDDALHELEFLKEDRPFTGHLTIGRFKADRGSGGGPGRLPAAPLSDRLIAIMKRFHETVSPPFSVDAVSVVKSDLKPAGPVYTTLATARLAGI